MPPESYVGAFGDEETYITEKSQKDSGVCGNYDLTKQDDVETLRKRYDELILYSDHELESFIHRLTTGTIDINNTVFIFMSDHGESFSNGWQGHHGPHLYDSIIRVPLIIKAPPGFHFTQGKGTGWRIDTPVELIDVAPTILEIAGIEVPEWMEGRSLVPLLQGGILETRPIFSMKLQTNRLFGNPITKGVVAVRYGDYKLIDYLDDEKKLLFNLKNDPGEINNILLQEPVMGEKLFQLIQTNIDKANEQIVGQTF